MLEDVRDTSGVWWIGLEADTEHIVLIFARYVEIVCACLVVLKV